MMATTREMPTRETPTRKIRSRSTAAVFAVAGLVLAGCSNEAVEDSEPPPASASAAPSSAAPSSAAAPSSSPSAAAGGEAPADAVAWMDEVCVALVPLAQRLQAPPPPNLTDPAATQQALSSYLGDAAQEAETAGEAITSAGAPPVEGGDQIAETVNAEVEELSTNLTEAQAEIDGVDPNDAAAVGRAAIGGAADAIGSVGNIVEVTTAVSEDQQLRQAFEQSADCEPLRTISVPS